MYVSLVWSLPGHEREYVAHLPATLDSVRIPGFQNDDRYFDLKEAIEVEVKKPGWERLRNYWFSDRGTRLEISGERNDQLIESLFNQLGYEVTWR